MSDIAARNKETARTFFSRLTEGQLDEALGMLSDEPGEWWVGGNDGPGMSLTLPQVEQQFRAVLSGPAKGVAFVERGIMADGDRVLVEIVGQGVLTTGKEYRNRYCFILSVRDGRITGAHEYMDTAHATSAFSGAAIDGMPDPS
jgi:ketosteroid isomerase-like protein